MDQGQVFEKSASAVGAQLASLLGHPITASFQMIVMLFILFFLYRDQKEALQLVRSMVPLTDEETEFLLARLKRAIQALVLGRFAVAGIQGLVSGVTLASLGVEGSILLGALTTLVAVVPAVGAFVVWLPIVIYLALTHHWIQAVILLVIGSLLISTLDNFLYPILVGSSLRMHTVPIFLSMLGGVWLVGVSGLILGPILFGMTSALILIWRHRTRGEPLEPDALVA